MKKLTSLLTLGLAVGALGTSAAFLSRVEKSEPKRTFAGEVELNKYLPFETSFTDYAKLGVLREATATTWSGRFNALDKFFTGENCGIGEDQKGSINSVSWAQSKTNKYVYFTWAGNAANYIEIRKASDNSVINSMTNDQFNGNPMVMNYLEVDTTDLVDGELVYLSLVDNSTEGYGFNTFGYLHVNASATDVSDAIWTHINSLTTDYDPGNAEADGVHGAIRKTMNIYLNGKAATSGILTLSSSKNTSANEDFEDNTKFLQRWYRDNTYDLDFGATKSWGTIISQADHHWNNNGLPFNKTGNGFFKGFFEDGTGFYDGDQARYRFVSKPFVLSGTGFVSVKMSGHTASLHVVRGDTELAFIDLRTFDDSKDAANVTSGFNTCTLVRHVINLNEFKGQVIQLAIADVGNAGWGAANFDELITKYDTNPSFKVDQAVQNSVIHNYYLDAYVSADAVAYKDGAQEAAVTEDTSVVKEAHDFLDYYYANFRTPGLVFSFCEVAGETKSALVTRYNALSQDAQAIVDASEDFDFGDTRTGDENWHWYNETMRKQYSVGYIVQYIAARFGISIQVKNSRSFIGLTVGSLTTNPAAMIIILSIAMAAIVSALFVLRAKKRKHN